VSEVVFQETLLKAAFQRRRGSIISRVRHLSFSHIHASITCLASFNVPLVLANFLFDFGQIWNAFHFSGWQHLFHLRSSHFAEILSFQTENPSEAKKGQVNTLRFRRHSSFYVIGLPFLCRAPVHRSL
jgi:hypothetical protein